MGIEMEPEDWVGVGAVLGVGAGDGFFEGKIGGKGIDLYLGAVIEWRYHKLYP